MKYYITNAFSINLLPERKKTMCVFHPLTVERAKMEIEGCEVISAIGHANTAAIVSSLLDRDIPANRIVITLEPYDGLLVAQYSGPRLPEGATELPEGAKIEFWTVVMNLDDLIHEVARNFVDKKVGFSELKRAVRQSRISTAEKQQHANNPRPFDCKDDPKNHPGYEPPL